MSSATPSITWAPPASIVYGTALSGTQLNASASVPGTFAYNPPAGTVLNAGASQTLSVIFTPTDTTSYSTATASVTISVTRATPSLTWPTPTSIVYGTVLSATQLNATTGVAGTFSYTPVAGTVLAAGAAQTLSVTFTPTDTTNYTTATTTVADHGHEGDAGDHLADAGRHRLRHDAVRDSAERDDERAWDFCLHACSWNGAGSRPRADVVGDVHADRSGELHDGDLQRHDQRDEGERRRLPGTLRRTSSTAPR